MRIWIWMAGLALLGAAAPARADDDHEKGSIVARVDGGFWARFAHPVKEGQRAHIRAFLDGENIGTARIVWAAPVAPFEVFLVDAKVTRSARIVAMRTPYQAWMGERTPGTYDTSETIAIGYSVVAERGSVGQAGDAILATTELLRTREETRDLAGEVAASSARDFHQFPDRIGEVLYRHRYDIWTDPVAARLVARLTDLVRERGGSGGRVPGDWFPPGLAKQKKQEATPNP